MRINNNVAATNAARSLALTTARITKNVERLSTGFRINRAGDDASGLVISNQLRGQVSGLRQAIRNAQDGVSVLQTAEGALDQMNIMLNRMRDLAVQAANTGSAGLDARTASQAEIDALSAEITRISAQTKFGSLNLLDGTFGVNNAMVTGFDVDDSYNVNGTFSLSINGQPAVTVTVNTAGAVDGAEAASQTQLAIRAALASSTSSANQAFASKVSVTADPSGAGSAITISVAGLSDGQTFTLTPGGTDALAQLGFASLDVTAASGTGGRFQVGANAGEQLELSFQDFSANSVGVAGINVLTDTGSADAIVSLDTAINLVSSKRGELGALQNRFESLIENLSVTTENLTASESRIRDTDMATEMVEFTKNQVLSQAGTAMLAQANTIPQAVLSLLRN